MKLLRNLFKPLLALLGWLVPKQKNLVVFAQWGGRYSDNSRALFEWMARHSEHQVAWLYTGKRPPQLPDDVAARARLIKRDSLAGAWCALRARVVIISHGFNDFGLWRYAVRRARSLMLWHAIMVKSAFLTDGSLSASRKRRYQRREAKHLDAVIASSDIDRYHTVAYMGVTADRVYVTGLPRQDSVTRAMQNRSRHGQAPVSVLYAPTYRDTPSARKQSLFFPFPDQNEAALADFCRQRGVQFLLRPHPNDKASVEHVYRLAERYADVFVPATSREVLDAAKLLPKVQLLLTDYSSIYLDLLPFDVPCLFLPFDIEEYSAYRGLAYYYDLITPGPKVTTQADFVPALKEGVDGADAWRERRELVTRMFFAYPEGGACERTARLVDHLVAGTHRRLDTRDSLLVAASNTTTQGG